MTKLKHRINKIEGVKNISHSKPVLIILGKNETKDDAIARHMKKYPEDKNAKTLVIDDIK